MADTPFRYKPLNVDNQTYVDIVKSALKKKNIIEDNPEQDKKTIVATPLTPFYLNTLTGPGLNYLTIYNKKRKEKGLEPIEPEFIKKYKAKDDEVDIGQEGVRAVTTAGTYILKGFSELITLPVDYAANTELTSKLDKITEDFLEHQRPETWQGDIVRLAAQYGLPSTWVSGAIRKLPQLTKIKKNYDKFRKTLSKIENKFLRRSAKLGTSIARRAGTAGLSFGVTEALIAESGRDTFFTDKVSEEGKTGRDLAAARFINKLKFGQEGLTFGAGFALAGKALPLAARYGLYKPIISGYGAPGSFVNKLTPAKIGARVANAAVINPAATILGGSTKAAIDSTIKNLANQKGVFAKLLTGLKPVAGVVDLPGQYALRPLARATNVAANVITKEAGTRILLSATAGGRAVLPQTVKNWKSTLPDFKDWRTFSVNSSDELKVALKKIDNVLSALRSVGKKTGEGYNITSAAAQEIKRSARRTEKLLQSIEKRAYKLANSFKNLNNTGKTSPASKDYYLNGVLEYLQGNKVLGALPKELQITSKALNDDLIQIRKTFAKLLPEGDLQNAILKNIKGYMRKSFAIFENPAYQVKTTSQVFKDAEKFALNLIRGKGGRDFRLNAKEIFPNLSQKAAEQALATQMVQKILRLGKQDMFDPIDNLNAIGKTINFDKFIATGEELPTVIRRLLGEEKSLKNQVMTTASAMVSQSTTKLMYDQLGKAMQKGGLLFNSENAAKAAGILDPVKATSVSGLGAMKSSFTSAKQPYWGAADVIEALTTTKGPLDDWIQNGFYKNLLQLKTGVQYGKTVLSPETQVRNFFSAGFFPLARGLVGGRSSVTDGIGMVVDDIWNAGKGDAQAELRLLANIDEGIKYGVLDENIVASELNAVLREIKNGKIASLNGLAKFLEKNPITEKAARLYAGGDNVWKWYTYNWYKSFTKDLFKNDMNKARQWFKEIAGRELQATTLTGQKVDIAEAIRQASAWYTRNTVPTYSKVPIAIQALRRTPFGNFVSFPAEMLRTTFNNLQISMAEAASSNPQLRSMGLRGMMGLFTVMGGASYGVKTLYNSFTGFDDEAMALYKKYFAPDYMKNSDMLAISKSDKGVFKVVNLSDFIPQAAVLEPVEAFFNTRKDLKKRDAGVIDTALTYMFNERGPVMSFFESYISTPIGFEPAVDIILRKGRKRNGGQIYSDSDSPSDKFEKMFNYILRTLEPGIVTTSRKFKDAFTKQPTSSGVLRNQMDVTIGASTGLKPFDADIPNSLDYLISEYGRIRTNVFKAEKFYKFDKMYTRGGDVLVQEYIDINKEAYRLQKEIYNAIQAAKKLGMSDEQIEDQFLARTGISKKVIYRLMDGEFVPVKFSESLFEKKLKIIARNEKRSGMNKKRSMNDDFHYPRDDLFEVFDSLDGTSINEPFKFDPKPKDQSENIINLDLKEEEPVKMASKKIETPPLPPQPAAVNITTAKAPVNEATGLTSTETALLSPGEQAIRLKQKGLA